MGYIVERESKGKWKSDPVRFKDLDDAEAYAESIYKCGQNARIIDERYERKEK